MSEAINLNVFSLLSLPKSQAKPSKVNERRSLILSALGRKVEKEATGASTLPQPVNQSRRSARN